MSSDIGTIQDRGEELTAFLDEWLRFYGPVSQDWLAGTLALSTEELTPALDDLQDTQRLVQGRLVVDGNEDDLCDSENFEILLRMARVAAVPSSRGQSAEFPGAGGREWACRNTGRRYVPR